MWGPIADPGRVDDPEEGLHLRPAECDHGELVRFGCVRHAHDLGDAERCQSGTVELGTGGEVGDADIEVVDLGSCAVDVRHALTIPEIADGYGPESNGSTVFISASNR
ncbi:hypothetical protein QM616_08055 [Rhodococcus fascians]|uniref:hypothetical protein n=1 Tax=Rhodococcoides fascians TaxID=1828 RepID=UPI0024B77BF1|nr:hypothetical protein [Rhodococcus fascians]MDJ0002664.1 hypothetical protein [Rhodococcus fascians]